MPRNQIFFWSNDAIVPGGKPFGFRYYWKHVMLVILLFFLIIYIYNNLLFKLRNLHILIIL